MYGDFQKEAKDYRPKGAVARRARAQAFTQHCRAKIMLLYHIVQPKCEAVLQGEHWLNVESVRKTQAVQLGNR